MDVSLRFVGSKEVTLRLFCTFSYQGAGSIVKFHRINENFNGRKSVIIKNRDGQISCLAHC